MNAYYSDNAFYKYIRDNEISNFEYVSGNLWQLVYGSADCQPKLLVLASAVEKSNLLENLTSDEKIAFSRLLEIARKANLPIICIRFDKNLSTLSEITIYTKDGFKTFKIDALTNFFKEKGLPVKAEPTKKNINDKSSSAYQDWQRRYLGNDLKVIDLDLFKIDLQGKIETIYELKRSQTYVTNWNPYTDDYNNYRLLANLSISCKIPAKVGYNRRVKIPFTDDISKIMTLDISIDQYNDPIFSNRSYYNASEFFGK